MKLLVLADDLTGALDTGIQFVDAGADTCVVLDVNYPLDRVDHSVEALVVDTESRHLPADSAAEIVREIVRQAKALGYSHIYKKMDATLRGNVGAELEAVLVESDAEQLHLLPAFPANWRTTEGGVQYVKGVPVEDSVFGKDPFNPVRHSRIADCLAEQTAVPTVEVALDAPAPDAPGIMIYDAVTDQDILVRAKELKEKGTLQLMAGCAGFASPVSGLLDFAGGNRPELQWADSFLVVCGSVNPITVEQIAYAEEHGFRHLRITPRQALTPGYFDGEEGTHYLEEWAACLANGGNLILDTNPVPGEETAYDFAEQQGITLEQLRVSISNCIGTVIGKLLAAGVDSTMLITGGDTLMGFIQQAGISEIVPVCEMVPGCVLSKITMDGKEHNIISKSGGLGAKTVLLEITEWIAARRG